MPVLAIVFAFMIYTAITAYNIRNLRRTKSIRLEARREYRRTRKDHLQLILKDDESTDRI